MSNLIIGGFGQDGLILTKLLISLNEKVFVQNQIGIYEDGKLLILTSEISKPVFRDFLVSNNVERIFFFAAESYSFEKRIGVQYCSSGDFVMSPIEVLIRNLLQAIRNSSMAIKVFFASSSLIFAGAETYPQNEFTAYAPLESYARDKIKYENLFLQFCKEYPYLDLYIGVFYNHESTYRKPGFFTRKVIEAALNQSPVQIISPNTLIDMSYAEDFMWNSWNLLNFCPPGKYLFSSGVGISALEFAIEVFDHVGLEWQKFVELNPTISTSSKVPLIGASVKLKSSLGARYRQSSESLSHRLTQDWKLHHGKP